MDYTVSVSEDKQYIIIKLHMPMTVEVGRRCGVDADELAKRNGLSRFLFDLRGAPNVESTTRNYEFAYKDIDEFGFSRSSRSAILVDPDDRSHDFIVTLFLNAGYIIEIFSDQEAAVAWLMK